VAGVLLEVYGELHAKQRPRATLALVALAAELHRREALRGALLPELLAATMGNTLRVRDSFVGGARLTSPRCCCCCCLNLCRRRARRLGHVRPRAHALPPFC